jgi:VanZ family protein
MSLTGLVAYWSVLILATHIPGGGIPIRLPCDKLLHLGAYAGLAACFALAWGVRKCLRARDYARLGSLLVAFAALDEFSQFAVPRRQPSIGDWAADIVGILAGFGAYALARSTLNQVSEERRSVPVEHPLASLRAEA